MQKQSCKTVKKTFGIGLKGTQPFVEQNHCVVDDLHWLLLKPEIAMLKKKAKSPAPRMK